MKVITRNNSDSYGKPRVYFCCHSDDFSKYFDKIIQDILSTHDCAIYYTEDMSEPLDEGSLDHLFENMRLLVVPVTMKLLCLPNRAMDVDIEYAKRRGIPILPFMMEPARELYTFYSNECKFGFLQFIDPNSSDATEIKYREKLKKYLDSVILSNDLVEKIKGAFYTQIFLSYRKKDRKYANELMRLIHDIPGGQSISIWYDEFLVFGEDWREGIWNAIQNSSLFAILVTPNLLEPDNFVMDKEYPYAKDNDMDILPIKMVSVSNSEIKKLTEKLKPSRIILPNDNEFKQKFLELCTKEATRKSDDDPMHNFLIGLAYLDGIGVEKDNKRAMQLITDAAESGLTEAIEMLLKIYSQSNQYTDADLGKWQEKLLENYKRKYDLRDPKVLHAMLDLTYFYGNSQPDKAADLLIERYNIISDGLDEYHPDRLAAAADLVACALFIGKYQLEREFAPALFSHITSPDCRAHQKLFHSLHEVASMLMRYPFEDYHGALKWEKAICDLKRRTLDENDEEIALSLNNIAKIMAKLESFEDYISSWEEAHRAYCNAYAPESEKTVMLEVDLALEYISHGQEVKGKDILDRSHALLCDLYSSSHPTAIRVLFSLGKVNKQALNCDIALIQLNEVYEWRKLYLGEFHEDTVDAYYHLANTCYKAREYEKALNCLQNANIMVDKLIDKKIECYDDTFSEDMWKKDIYMQMVECCLFLGRHQEAYDYQKKVCMYANMEDPFEETEEERKAGIKLKEIRELISAKSTK